MESSINCKNCSSEVIGSFCHKCGQKSSVNKVSFKETFQDFIDTVLSVNAPLITTTKILFVNPGILFREYLNGKRKSYYKPVSFFIITTLIYIIVRSLINYNPMTTAGVKVEGKILVDAGKYMVKNINNIMFLFVFALGVLFKLFFYRKNSLAEFIAISFYAVGVYTMIGLVSMFYLKYVDPQYTVIPIVVFMGYVIFAFSSFFKSRKITTILKIFLVYTLSFMVYSGIGFLLSFLIVWLKTS